MVAVSADGDEVDMIGDCCLGVFWAAVGGTVVCAEVFGELGGGGGVGAPREGAGGECRRGGLSMDSREYHRRI